MTQLSKYVKIISDTRNEPGRINQVVFELSKPNSPDKVLMRVVEPDAHADTIKVVVVNAEKFHAAWKHGMTKNNVHFEVTNGNTQSWKMDRKYKLAEAGFLEPSLNPDNQPVELALVDSFLAEPKKTFIHRIKCMIGIKPKKEKSHQVEFSDGVTRTIWLIANGYEEFPVECQSGEDLLLAAAGATNSKIFQPYPNM